MRLLEIQMKNNLTVNINKLYSLKAKRYKLTKCKYIAKKTFYIVRETNINQSRNHKLTGVIANNVYWTEEYPNTKHQTVSKWSEDHFYYDFEPLSQITNELIENNFISLYKKYGETTVTLQPCVWPSTRNIRKKRQDKSGVSLQ